MNQQELADLFSTFDTCFTQFCERRADAIGDHRQWGLWTIFYDKTDSVIEVVFHEKQGGKDGKQISFVIPQENPPSDAVMQQLKHYVNAEVIFKGFQGFKQNIPLPQGLVKKMLQGDENAYEVTLHEFCLRYRNALSEEKIEELLQETIKQTLALKRRNTDMPEIQIFNSILPRLYRQKTSRKANFTVNVEHLPELGIECVDDGPDIPSAMVEKMQKAVKETTLTDRQRQVIEMLVANPEFTLEDIAQSIAKPGENPLTKERIRQLRDKALEKIITKAAALGYEDLVKLYLAKQNSCSDRS